MNFIYGMNEIYWREPLWFLLALLPFVSIALRKIVRKNNLSLYVEKTLQPWVVLPTHFKLTTGILNKNTAYILAWLLFAIAMAGPQTPLYQPGKEHYLGANIMLVTDLSPSMQATDIIPNRLRRAKLEIFELLEKAKNHRIGITVFSARPHVYVPLTYDHSVLKNYLDSLDSLKFPTVGSDPVSAILLAKKELEQLQGKSAIVLITDGDFSDKNHPVNLKQLDELKQANIPLYILGVGSAEGEAIQQADGSWLKYQQRAVISKMDENILQLLANNFAGKYSAVYDDDTDWNTLYENGISHHVNKVTANSKQQILWQDHFIYFLVPALFLFWISLIPYRFKISTNITSLGLIFIFSCITPGKDALAFEMGQTTEQAAFKAYNKGEYVLSDNLYKNIPGYRGYSGRGNSLYKMGHYQQAIQQFSLAVLNANTDANRANALYNLANSYFRSGAFTLAINTYNDALKYQPGNKAILFNIKTSKVLQKNIELRIKEQEKNLGSRRQGRGPRSASLAEGSEIGENSSVSTGESDTKLDGAIPLPELPHIKEDILKKILVSGLKNVKLAENSSTSSQSFNNGQDYSTIENADLNQLQLKINVMQDSQYRLWKRLFEIEEGFPAPVETPHTLPGVNPW